MLYSIRNSLHPYSTSFRHLWWIIVTFSVAELFVGFTCNFAHRGAHNSSGQSCFAVNHVYCFIDINRKIDVKVKYIITVCACIFLKLVLKQIFVGYKKKLKTIFYMHLRRITVQVKLSGVYIFYRVLV